MALSPTPSIVVAQRLSNVHPNHRLLYYSDDRGYTCDICKTVGFGARFLCQPCAVNIHVYCSDIPRELSCFFHIHRLLQVAQTHLRRNCDLCREPINGLSYRCEDCDFDVHPLCTQFPRELRHVIDNKHKLRLQRVSGGSCGVCRNDCSFHWVYGCGLCRVNIHLKCLREQYDSRNLRKIPHAPSRWQQEPAFQGAAARPYHHYRPPAQLPNFHFWYRPGPVNLPPQPPPPPVAVPYYYNHAPGGYWPPPPPPPRPPLHWGSLFLDTIFSLIGNVAAGAINDFLFGSISF